MPQPLYIKATTLDYFKATDAVKALAKLTAADQGLQALRHRCVADGFKPHTGTASGWGTKATWTQSDNKVVSFEFSLHAYRAAASKDQAAIFVASMNGPGGARESYRGYLIAPKGDYAKSKEFYLSPANKILAANSWFTRLKKCIKSRCGGSTCISSFGTCNGGWADYLACVALACGCYVACAGCASCNCKGWCKWVVGCCKG